MSLSGCLGFIMFMRINNWTRISWIDYDKKGDAKVLVLSALFCVDLRHVFFGRGFRRFVMINNIVVRQNR